MAWATKTIGIILGSLLAILILKEWVLVPIGIIILLFVIRFIADLYWSGKDDGKW
jgi:hypothetical protein